MQTTPVDGGWGEFTSRMQSALSLFKYENLSEPQEQAIRAALMGQDVLCILPTGGGKSACFQIPGVVRCLRTIVISPLIALQDDQVLALRALGIKAFALHSNLTDTQKSAVLYYFKTSKGNEPSFLYISPELLLTEMFDKAFSRVRFDLVAVDEAHCVSTWGDGFRPDYQRIALAVARMKIPQCLAFSATIDPKIEADITHRVPLRPGFVRVIADPMRDNLNLSLKSPELIADTNKEIGAARMGTLAQLLSDEDYRGPTIIYINSRIGAFTYYERYTNGTRSEWCKSLGYTPYLFHAQLDYEDKKRALQGFLKNERPLVFATSAFGMGINRADVRQVIHLQPPMTLVDYAQQIGRAGRDGKASLCTTFMLAGDTFHTQTYSLQLQTPSYDFVEGIHRRLMRVYSRMPVAKRTSYNIHTFMNYLRAGAEESDKIKNPASYITRAGAALAVLQAAGVIYEHPQFGLQVFEIEPASDRQLKLLQLTGMRQRMLIREQKRLAKFFGTAPLNQRFLWDILSADDIR